MQKILIVDDEPMMLRIATKILSQKYETVTASSGEEAIEIFEVGFIDAGNGRLRIAQNFTGKIF